jgi:hypothetical protein
MVGSITRIQSPPEPNFDLLQWFGTALHKVAANKDAKTYMRQT